MDKSRWYSIKLITLSIGLSSCGGGTSSNDTGNNPQAPQSQGQQVNSSPDVHESSPKTVTEPPKVVTEPQRFPKPDRFVPIDSQGNPLVTEPRPGERPWGFGPVTEPKPEPTPPVIKRTMISDEELERLKSHALLHTPDLEINRSLAAFGHDLFHDKRLSYNGSVACATCHRPDRGFSDGRSLAVGVGQVARHSPTLINVAQLDKLFWDGRAPSLAEQAKGPIEAAAEHGISRGQLARLMLRDFRYVSGLFHLFGYRPSDELRYWVDYESAGAYPAATQRYLTDSVAEAIWDTIASPSVKRQISGAARDNGESVEDYLQYGLLHEERNQAWVDVYNAMSSAMQNEINDIFSMFAQAVAAFETTITADNSAFDRFVRRLIEREGHLEAAYSPDFGPKQWDGYKVFSGPGRCGFCHAGPYFTDQRFHNIGLGQANKHLDVGRAAVDQEIESIGAFKTPTLRGLPQTSPYMHDGQMGSLPEVLKHYNSLKATPAVGVRNPRLRAVHLSPDQLSALEAFLWSLDSEIQYLKPAPF